MKPFEDIIAEATDEDGTVQLDVAITQLVAAIESSGVELSPGDNIAAFIGAQKDINIYMARLILEVAAEVNALPNGFDDEFATFVAYLDFTILSALHQQITARQQTKPSGLTVVTGEYPPLSELK